MKDGQELKKLPLEFNRAGFHWKQIARTEEKAIYSGTLKSGRVNVWEVIMVRKAPAGRIMGVPYPPREVFPKTSDWGSYGWTFNDEERAMKKYNTLN